MPENDVNETGCANMRFDLCTSYKEIDRKIFIAIHTVAFDTNRAANDRLGEIQKLIKLKRTEYEKLSKRKCDAYGDLP